MPTPRRKIHYRATDKAVPVYHQQPRASTTIQRCERCKCRLASDQTQHYCSPCQATMSGTPQLVHDYLN